MNYSLFSKLKKKNDSTYSDIYSEIILLILTKKIGISTCSLLLSVTNPSDWIYIFDSK